MIENEVNREDIPDVACHDCGKPLCEVAAYATYMRDEGKEYKCNVCYESDPVLRRRTEVYSRVAGYLRPVEQWNVGKQSEFRDRKTYKVGA